MPPDRAEFEYELTDVSKPRKPRRVKLKVIQSTVVSKSTYTCSECPWKGPGDWNAVLLHLEKNPFHVIKRERHSVTLIERNVTKEVQGI